MSLDASPAYALVIRCIDHLAYKRVPKTLASFCLAYVSIQDGLLLLFAQLACSLVVRLAHDA